MTNPHAKSLEELQDIFDSAHDGCPFKEHKERMAAGILAVYAAGKSAGREDERDDNHQHLRRCYARDIFKILLSRDDEYTFRKDNLPIIARTAWLALDIFEAVSDEIQRDTR